MKVWWAMHEDLKETCFEVLGYSLNCNEKYRDLPYVGILKPEVYSE